MASVGVNCILCGEIMTENDYGLIVAEIKLTDVVREFAGGRTIHNHIDPERQELVHDACWAEERAHKLRGYGLAPFVKGAGV